MIDIPSLKHERSFMEQKLMIRTVHRFNECRGFCIQARTQMATSAVNKRFRLKKKTERSGKIF